MSKRTKDYKKQKEFWLLLAVLGSLVTKNGKMCFKFLVQGIVRELGTFCVCVKSIRCNSKIDIANNKTSCLMPWVAEFQIKLNSHLCQIS